MSDLLRRARRGFRVDPTYLTFMEKMSLFNYYYDRLRSKHKARRLAGL